MTILFRMRNTRPSGDINGFILREHVTALLVCAETPRQNTSSPLSPVLPTAVRYKVSFLRSSETIQADFIQI